MLRIPYKIQSMSETLFLFQKLLKRTEDSIIVSSEPIFDSIAERYDSWYRKPIGRYADEVEWNCIKGLLPSKKGRILDLGCGTGLYTERLMKMGFDVVSLDYSMEMLRVAKGKMDSEFIRGDAMSLPFRDSVFDGIVAVTSFEFFPDPKGAIEEMRRVVKNGGFIVVGVLSRPNLWSWSRRKKELYSSAHFYTYFEMRELFRPEKIVACLYAHPKAKRLGFWKRMEPILSKIFPFFGAFIAILSKVEK